MEVVVVLAEGGEVVFKGLVAGFCKDIVPDELCVEVVEKKAAEQAVFGISDEVQDLTRRAGENCRESGILDVHVFAILAADVGDGLVVKGLSEAVGVVAVVGAECVGEGVSFRLEHKACAAVVIEDLIDCCG